MWACTCVRRSSYSDKFGEGKTASAVSERRVEARTLSNASPSFAGQDDDERHRLHRGRHGRSARTRLRARP